MNGQMVQRMMMDQNLKAAENQGNLTAMQKRLEELESRLLEVNR